MTFVVLKILSRLEYISTKLESKLAQTHVALTGPTRQQVLQLMMTRLKILDSLFSMKNSLNANNC